MRQSIPCLSRVRTRSVACLPVVAALAFLSGLCSTVACAQPVAVVVDRTGEVSMGGPNPARPVALLDILDVGSHLELARAARLVLLYTQTG